MRGYEVLEVRSEAAECEGVVVELVEHPLWAGSRAGSRRPRGTSAPPERRGRESAGSKRCRLIDAWRSAEFLGEPYEKPFGPADVAEPIHVFVLDHLADELGAVLAEPGERIVDVVHGEHDA
jgi:hypothetical protein